MISLRNILASCYFSKRYVIKAVKPTLKSIFTTLFINALLNNNARIRYHLSRLSESRAFSKSPVNHELQKYVVSGSLKEKPKDLKSPSFKTVFEVKEEDRTDFDIRLIRLDALPDSTAEIWP
ncbi:hypothetical protein [Sunxiuqinia sp. sy24]|uniref:hypothetical protein n=1 Tax=Sunxiuqinia sp. sy24 TaxID=3461495 RepID=UPI004046380E